MINNSSIRKILQSRSAFLLIILVALIIVIVFITNGSFLMPGNIRGIFLSLIVQAIMLTGLTCLLIGGEIDLSMAGQATVSAMLFAQINVSLPAIPWGINLVICLCFGAGIGLLHSFYVNVLKFPSFIATIGMASVYSGIAQIWTRGNCFPIARQGFDTIGNVAIFDRFPVLFVIAGIIVIAYGFVLSRTIFGRNAYMIGGNAAASRLSGINVNRVRMTLFINNSVLASLAGIFWAALMKMASPTAITTSLPDFTALSAVILGGVAFFGGHGFIAGAFCGLALINVFNNTLTLLGVPSYWNVTAQGALLVIALIIDDLNEKRVKNALLAAAAKAAEAGAKKHLEAAAKET